MVVVYTAIGTPGSARPKLESATQLHIIDRHTVVTGVEAGRKTLDPVRPRFTHVPQMVVALANAQVRDRNL